MAPWVLAGSGFLASAAGFSASGSSLDACLNSLMDWPRPLASEGSLEPPKKISTITRMTMSSVVPMPAMARRAVGAVIVEAT